MPSVTYILRRTCRSSSFGYDSFGLYVKLFRGHKRNAAEFSVQNFYGDRNALPDIRKLNQSIPFQLNRRDIIIRAYGLIRCLYVCIQICVCVPYMYVYLVFAFGTDAKNK